MVKLRKVIKSIIDHCVEDGTDKDGFSFWCWQLFNVQNMVFALPRLLSLKTLEDSGFVELLGTHYVICTDDHVWDAL